ncbi:MAG: NAD(P)/FAD-dependent oxidoreductase [Lachnospiraceae bacterium]
MIKINQVKIPVSSGKEALESKCAKLLGISVKSIKEMTILRHSIDARKDQVFDVYQVALKVDREEKILSRTQKKNALQISRYEPVKYDFYSRRRKQESKPSILRCRPVIIGAGPAGYFCGLMLAEHGYRPMIIERGKPVEQRRKDVEQFFSTGKLLSDSNVQFGEGGAGTFSDGKLNTLVKDQEGRSQKVLQIFVEFGAAPDILYESKPHVGTDVLHRVLVNMRKKFLSLGGEIIFETRVKDFLIQDGKVTGVDLSDGRQISTEVCVLAIGHSARDTFEVLNKTEVEMEAKSFAVGLRVEHPQQQINVSQYGERFAEKLPTASYKLTANTQDQRSVYSFCMCPGGYVVNASSEEDLLAVNGMSYHARDGKNANSALIVSVTPEDYPEQGPLGGVRFQQQLEKKAYELGQGCIPQQLFGDFEANRLSNSYGEFESQTRGKAIFANLRELLPEQLNLDLVEGMHLFGKRIHGFDRKDAILSGVESRTSSPVRIKRNEQLQSNIEGLFPCGEGAGYAGGIMSAAMDGLRIAEQIAALYDPQE